jgi:two-component system response regulator FixJ
MTIPAPMIPDVYVADDDNAVRDALGTVLELEGFRVKTFAEGSGLLAATRMHMPNCIILDVHMPGRSGIDVLSELGPHCAAQIFMISGQGDIPMAVEAIRRGAHDFIEKPFDATTVVTRIREALAARKRLQDEPVSITGFPGEEALTPREREVLERIAMGASNKEAGRQLGISPRTIEVHRARIMEKIGAKNTADLVRLVYSDQRRG